MKVKASGKIEFLGAFFMFMDLQSWVYILNINRYLITRGYFVENYKELD